MISIIVPVYYNKIELYQTINTCFESIATHCPEIELLAIDDASPMDSSDWPITYRHGQNRGYTATVNEGLKRATGDIIIVSNDDLVWTKELIDRFKTISGLGVFSPKTTDEGFGDKFGSIWGMTRETFNKLGLLDESMAAYFSDLDYYTRAKEASVPIHKWEDITIEHQGGATYSGLSDRIERYESDKQAYAKKWGRVD